MPDARRVGLPRGLGLVASAEEVHAAVQRLAAEIGSTLGERYPLVLVVMGGAVVFAGKILPLLRFPLDFDYVRRATAPPRAARTWSGACGPWLVKSARCSCWTTSWTTAKR